MNHPLENEAPLYVLDLLPPGKRAEFERELQRSPELAAIVAEIEAAAADALNLLPRRLVPASLFEKIEDEIEARQPLGQTCSTATRATQKQETRPTPLATWLARARWGLAAVIALSLGILAYQSVRAPSSTTVLLVGLTNGSHRVQRIALSGDVRNADDRFIELARLAESFWQKPDGTSDTSAVLPGKSRCFALFDPQSRQGFLGIEALPPLEGRQRYLLWIADGTDGVPTNAGVLPVDDGKGGLYSFTLKNSREAKSRLFVTVEDDENNERPRGPVVLGGL